MGGFLILRPWTHDLPLLATSALHAFSAAHCAAHPRACPSRPSSRGARVGAARALLVGGITETFRPASPSCQERSTIQDMRADPAALLFNPRIHIQDHGRTLKTKREAQ